MPATRDAPARHYADARAIAARWGVCLRTVRTWDAAGIIPRPERFGPKLLRWNLEELAAWEAAGRPRRDVWEVAKASRTRRS